MDKRPTIAIACQGGGSQTAFTAGALKALLEEGVLERFRLVTLSGTSGGAMCALLVWYAINKGDARPWERLLAFWHDNTAKTDRERKFNRNVIQSLRMISRGQLPLFHVSPSSPMAAMMMAFATQGLRPEFTDLRALLGIHVDFAEIARWGARAERPLLLMGAVNVLTGRLATFSSRLEAIRIEHVLASCAVPNVFPAVELDGGAYWDGLFSDNPPVTELIEPALIGHGNIPEEIWVIKINATRIETVPSSSEEIDDRRNALIGNISLFQQIDALSLLNDLMIRGAFRPEFVAAADVHEPVRLPKCYPDDPDRPYHIPFIEMSPELSARLDYASKLDRDPAHIEALMADGARQARAFLAAREPAG